MNELVLRAGALPSSASSRVVPAAIAAAGEQASWGCVEFFTANIRNPHTRRDYARANGQFFAWCRNRGLSRMSQPGEKPAACARIGPARVRVADIGGEEFDVAPARLLTGGGEP